MRENVNPLMRALDRQPIATESIQIRPEEVHVWHASLDLSRAKLLLLASTLSHDERARAARFQFMRHARRFVASRGILRSILTCYLGVDPRTIRFSYQAHGKPVLGPGFEGAGIQFNVSHSDDLAIYAVGRCQVGVDVELARPVPDAFLIARSIFSARENALLLASPKEEQAPIFLRYWTRKEALVKALGRGLTVPLDSIDVALAPGEPTGLPEVGGPFVVAENWTLTDLNLGAAAIGAVVMEQGCTRLALREWSEP